MEEKEEVVMDTVVSREERLGGATKNSGRGQGWTGRTHGATAEFGSEITKGGERESERGGESRQGEAGPSVWLARLSRSAWILPWAAAMDTLPPLMLPPLLLL